MKPFEIFRSGTHRPVKGDAPSFGESDLAAMASGYDPAKHQAPIVVGHPKLDAPAYGWIGALQVKGDRLVATPADVDASFAELVRARRFGKVSASFYLPDAAGNPTPGSYYLRHVGFLGAQPPSVKGLRPVEFADGDELVTVEFADWQLPFAAGVTARLFRRLREMIIAKDGVEKADEVLPDWDIQAISEAAEADRSPSVPAAFSETEEEPTMATPTEAEKARQAELDRRDQELAAREASFAERERAARTAEDSALVASIVEAGRLPIGLQGTATALFAELGEDTISFAEGDVTHEMSPRAAFRALLEGLPIPVETRELAAGKTGGIDFSDSAAVAVAITSEIDSAKAKGETLSAADALGRIQSGATA